MKRNLMLLLSALALPAMLCVFAVPAQNAPRRIEITAKRFNFMPAEITVEKGQPVVLVLKSVDVAHGLRISGLGVNMKVKAGGTTEAQFTPDKTGDFTGHCSTFCGPGHGTMKFNVHVVN